MNKLLQILTFGLYNKMKKKDTDNFFVKATKENNNVNPVYVFMLGVLCVGVLLLFVPVIGMLVDIWFNHTMTINLSDMAVYVGAVAAIFTSGGVTAAITEYSYSKFDIPPIDEDGNDMILSEEESCSRKQQSRRYRKSNTNNQ